MLYLLLVLPTLFYQITSAPLLYKIEISWECLDIPLAHNSFFNHSPMFCCVFFSCRQIKELFHWRKEDSSYITTTKLRQITVFGSLFSRGTACSANLLLPLPKSTPSREKDSGQTTMAQKRSQEPLVFVMMFSCCELSLSHLLYKPLGGFLIFLLVFVPSVFSESL